MRGGITIGNAPPHYRLIIDHLLRVFLASCLFIKQLNAGDR